MVYIGRASSYGGMADTVTPIEAQKELGGGLTFLTSLILLTFNRN